MKNFYFLLIIIFSTLTFCSPKLPIKTVSEKNETNNFKSSKSFDHITHIRKQSQRNRWHINQDKTKPKYLVDYVIKNLLKHPDDIKYITDRKLLRKLENKTCWENYVLIKDTLSSGDKCEIEIELQNFNKKQHKIDYKKENRFISRIDRKYPFGAIYYKPESELKSLKELKSVVIKINGNKLDTKIEKYRNLYNPNFCNFGMNIRIIEAYEDGENLYIYLFGGSSASSYFAKLIFNQKKFITSIVVDYIPMSMYGSFGNDFIGF